MAPSEVFNVYKSRQEKYSTILIFIFVHYSPDIQYDKRYENGFQNEELHIMYRSPKIVRVINSIGKILAGQIAKIEESRRALPNF